MCTPLTFQKSNTMHRSSLNFDRCAQKFWPVFRLTDRPVFLYSIPWNSFIPVGGTASHGRSSSSTKFTIVAYNRATASAAALFFCLFRPFVKESSILPPEKMLLFRKWNSIIYYCAVFFGLLASSKKTRPTEKKEERAAARRYRAAARNIAWNSFSSAFPRRSSQVC